jgi:Tol biopolymer transport system component
VGRAARFRSTRTEGSGIRITLTGLLAVALAGPAALTACGAHYSTVAPAAGAAAGSTGPSAVYVDPAPGERRLRNIRQLTFGGNNAEAYFNRAGTQLVFQRQERVDSGCDQEYLINVDGSGLRRVSNGLGRTTCGYFYDGDRRVLYSSTFKHAPECPPKPDHSKGYVWPLAHLEIFTSKLDGSDLRQLTDDGAYNAEATVSPDGKRIVFTSTRDGDIELYVMNVDGSDVRRLTHRVGYDGGAFFSPDGRKIVWRAGYPQTAADSADYRSLLAQRLVRPSRVELWVANADGSDARQITHLGGANFAPFFHPDGRRIVFSSNHEEPRSGHFDLYLVNVDGSGLEQVTTDSSFDGFPMFSPDGRKFAWASNRHGRQAGETDLFIADWVE